MLPALSIAQSGMLAASRRLQTSASNLANMDSTGSLSPGGPAAYQSQRVVQTPVTGGGVATTTQPVTPAALPQADPQSPLADARGMVAAPNVDVIAEVTNMVMARDGFASALQVAQVSSDMIKHLFELD